jgi:hypothetical protein
MHLSKLLLALTCVGGLAAASVEPVVVTETIAIYDRNHDGLLDDGEQADARSHGWTGTRTVTGSNGRTASSTTTGTATDNGDGTGTRSSTTAGTATGAKGQERSWNTERAADWKANDQGGRDVTRTEHTTLGNGTTVDRSTTGSSAKTDDGHTWTGTTTGSSSTGKSWTTETEGSVTKNGDGTATVDKTRTTTTSDGQTRTATSTGTVTKTEDGRSYTGERQVNRNGGEAERSAKVARDTSHDDGKTQRTGTVERGGGAKGHSGGRGGRR